MTVEDIIRGINQASYEAKEVLIKTNYLIMLKNEIEYLRKVVEAKNKVIKEQQKQINDLTSKIIIQDYKKFDQYV